MRMELVCSAILFDLDGVLVDSEAIVARHWRNWAINHDIPPERILAIFHGRPSVEVVRLVAPRLNAEVEARLMEAAASIDLDGLSVYEAARPLLERLPAGSWAVVTSGSKLTASSRLGFGDFPQPAVLITADDVAHGKPHPEPYATAAERLGVAPEHCLVIEDAPAGIESGKAAGMRVIAVTTSHAPAQLSQADVVVDELGDLTVDVVDGQLRVWVRQKAQQ